MGVCWTICAFSTFINYSDTINLYIFVVSLLIYFSTYFCELHHYMHGTEILN